MNSPDPDRNLLFGILAMQMNFISREDLITVTSVWIEDKHQSLDKIILQREMIQQDEHELLAALMNKLLEKHDNDAQKSLAALSSVDATVREDLSRLADSDVDVSLGHVGKDHYADDRFATQSFTIGETSTPGGRFRILPRPHAKGGLGEVSIAFDEELKREVALKEIQKHRADEPTCRDRFVMEAEITGALEHPGIVPIYGLGQYADGRPFYAMRFIRGKSLRDAIEQFHGTKQSGREAGERSLEIRRLLGRFIDVCQAVEYAHNRGVLHRDLKPGNVMLGEYGETLLVDWGLAKLVDPPPGHEDSDEPMVSVSSGRDTSRTLHGKAIGTPAFMSPEQAAGRLDILGPATDVYSLGATLYSLLTGRGPFESDGPEILQEIQRGEFPRPRSVDAAIPQPLDAICTKAMSRRQSDRYPSAAALAQDVERYLADEPVLARREPFRRRANRWMRRHRGIVGAGSAAMLVAFAASVIAVVLLSAANQRERKARNEATDNYLLARTAVDEFLLKITEDPRLETAALEPLRRELLLQAKEFYDQLLETPVSDSQTAAEVHAERGRAHRKSAYIIWELDGAVDGIEEMKRAITVLEASAAEFPNNNAIEYEISSCKLTLGTLAYRLNRREESEQAWREGQEFAAKLVEAEPDNVEYRKLLSGFVNNRGTMYGDTGRSEQGIAEIRNALGLLGPEPDYFSMVASYNLARLLVSTGQTEEGIQQFEDVIESLEALVNRPNRFHVDMLQVLALAHNELARHYLHDDVNPQRSKEHLQAARDWGEELVRSHPDVPKYHLTLFDSLLEFTGGQPAEQSPEVEETLRDALARLDGLPESIRLLPRWRSLKRRALQQLAYRLKETDRYEESQETLLRALELAESLHLESPDSKFYSVFWGWVHYDLGILLRETEDLATALLHLRKAVSISEEVLKQDPKFGLCRHRLYWGYVSLFQLLYTTGDFDGAVAVGERALASGIGSSVMFYNLGILAGMRGDSKLAVKAYRKALEIDETNATAWCNLGHRYRRLGQFEDALPCFLRGHELGSKEENWPYPSEYWVNSTKELMELEPRLPEIRKYQVTSESPETMRQYAVLCFFKSHFHEATQWYSHAYDAEPKGTVSDFDVESAALASMMDDVDSDETRIELRTKAIEWLEVFEQLMRVKYESGKTTPADIEPLDRYPRTISLACIREPELLKELPAELQQRARDTWERIGTLAELIEQSENSLEKTE